MKKRIVFLVLAFACLSGALVAQTFQKPKHMTPSDELRNSIFDEEVNSNNLFMLFIRTDSTKYFEKFKVAARKEITALETALDPEKEVYKIWLWKKIKGMNIKGSGKWDFGGEKGDTISFNPSFNLELIDIPNFTSIYGEISSGFKRDDKISSIEGTVGARLEFPHFFNYCYLYGRMGVGAKSPGGNNPTSAIVNCGPGFGIKLDKKWSCKVEIELLYYWASNPIFSDGSLKKQHDLVLNVGISYSFAISPKPPKS